MSKTKIVTSFIFVCDFCGKTEGEVETIITGHGDIAICNECVDVCVKTIKEADDKREADTK